MFLTLLSFLSQLGIKIPAAFDYTSTRMILASLSSFLITLLLGPGFIRFLYKQKIGQQIREDLLALKHGDKKDTPTMGGLLITISLLISLLFWMDLFSPFTWILLVATLAFGIIGGLDDYLKLKYKSSRGISGMKKLLVQSSVGFLLFIFLLRPDLFGDIRSSLTLDGSMQSDVAFNHVFALPFFKSPLIISGVFGMLFLGALCWLVVTGSSNAVNLTDGLDGLAAGCTVFTAAVLAVFALISSQDVQAAHLNLLYIQGSGEVAIYLASVVGASVAFLWYNGHPALVFMGDVGSLTLGGILGVSALLIRRELILFIAGGIFVIEALSVIIQVLSFKYRGGKRVFLIAPIHHHFEHLGWPETRVVLRFWLINFILALLALSTIKLQ